ncbi:hypothetical protein BACCELL_02176 [Bacteroides cellulosilyticus DSM 14838]|uniref:Uncharacterized protein n=1 Tax=Bacteroides cellulosilyticus DSM 14838 TaxID=537012 RepID=E2ND18_9BACE|nr:hypothetical protein BACCELL_02176 [Bacteroides cellulosilyticus DSM 14838]
MVSFTIYNLQSTIKVQLTIYISFSSSVLYHFTHALNCTL